TERSFSPFNFKKNTKDVFETIVEKPHSSRFGSYELIDHFLNGEKNDKQPNEEQFLRLFNNATKEAVELKIENN
ncbi:MAG: hypothetical protein IKP73_02985, partial [Bacteroidales bacterium]|nr:hypothetical protein [Bacteroidales bacterium]